MSVPRTYYTIDDLYMFCKNQNFTSFSAKEHGQPIVVTVPGNFEVEQADMPGMLKTKLKVCHTGVNRNKSHISESNMKKYMGTLKYRPILAYIHQLPDGTYDFYAHNVEFVEDENGDVHTDFLEKQVGCFTADEPYLKYDKKNDKTYVNAYAVIPEEYTMAADIIRRKKGTKVSCELVINELSYNAKEDYLDLTDFYFGATTLLGCDEEGRAIEEGMEGARLDIQDFCHNEPVFTYQEQLIETLEKLNTTLSMFTINNNNTNQEEVSKEMGHFEELLEKYSVEREAIDFEFEGLSDEELDAVFEEKFGEAETTEDVVEEAVEEEFEEGSEEELTDEEVEEEIPEAETEEFSVEDIVVSFRISHEDVRYGLQNLLNSMNGDSHYYVVDSVYDKYFYYVDWMTPNMDAFRQAYKTRKDVLSFDGDAEPVYRDFVTQAERDELEKMRKNYAELKEFKENFDATELKAQKDAIFGREEFSVLAEDEAFIELKNTMDNFTVEEIESKAKQIFADHVIKNGQFAMNNDAEPKQSKKIGFNYTESSKKKSAYGGLFDE